MVGNIDGCGDHNGDDGGRGAKESGEFYGMPEIWEEIVCSHEKESAGYTTENVEAEQLSGLVVFKKNSAEGVKPKQIHKNMQQLVMQKHVGKKSPGAAQKLPERGGKSQPVNVAEVFVSPENKKHSSQPDSYPDRNVDVDQLCEIGAMLVRELYFVGKCHV
jgi:hypothetical protein